MPATPRGSRPVGALLTLLALAACGDTTLAPDSEPTTITLDTGSVLLTAVEGAPDPEPVTVAVGGEGATATAGLTVTVDHAAGVPTWLEAGLDRTITPALLTLVARVSPLAAGGYGATVHVEAPGAERRSLEVELTVEPRPSLALSETSSELSALAGSTDRQSWSLEVLASHATVSDLASRVTGPAGEPVGWLTARLSRAETPATLELELSAEELSPGRYTAGVEVTSPGAANGSVTHAVAVVVVGQPDLRLEGDLPTGLAVPPGGDFSLSGLTVVNEGTAPAEDFWVIAYLSKDDRITRGDRNLGGFRFEGVLAPGERFEIPTTDHRVPPIEEPGAYHLGVIVDASLAIPESDETNNVVQTPMTVAAPPPS